MENISYGKIVLIGAGHVGSAILDSLLRMNLADEIVVINRNEKKALACYRIAAEKGNAAAQYNLGTYYMSNVKPPDHRLCIQCQRKHPGGYLRGL